MNYEKILENIWLSSSQAKIYSTLAWSGAMSIYEISRKSWLHRPQIYKTLPSLIHLSLVSSVIKGKRKVYTAENPKYLIDIFKKNQSHFEQALDHYSSLFEKQTHTPELRTIHGKRFSLSVFDDVLLSLSEGDCFYRYSSRNVFQKDSLYNNRREKWDIIGIQMLSITNHLLWSQQQDSLNHETKIIPPEFDLFEDNISKVIYKDKVAIIDYDNEVSFVIQDKKFAEFETKIFQLLFKKLQW